MKKQKFIPIGVKGYWHISGVDYCELFYGTYEDIKEGIIDGNEYGPFKTLGECKKDAIDYHRCTIRYARMAIQNVKDTKLKDLKNKNTP